MFLCETNLRGTFDISYIVRRCLTPSFCTATVYHSLAKAKNGIPLGKLSVVYLSISFLFFLIALVGKEELHVSARHITARIILKTNKQLMLKVKEDMGQNGRRKSSK